MGGTWKTTEAGSGPSFDARAAAYIAAENSAEHDAKMLGAQGNVYLPFDETKVHVSTAIYDWTNVASTLGTPVAATNQGNNDTEFLVWETFGAVTIPGGPLDEMSGYLQFMVNMEKGEQGVVLGTQLELVDS